MKRNRLLALLFALLFVLVASTGCGGGASGATEDMFVQNGESEHASPESPKEEMGTAADGTASAAQNANLPAEAKLIYTGELELQTTDMDAASGALNALIIDIGGYIQNQDVYRESSYKRASYTVRVPGARFFEFLNCVSENELCTVTYQSTTTEDVGEQYADIENRIETLQIKLDRLQELLTKAENMEDIITIESEITDVEYQIELYSGEKNRYDSLINYSTVYINLREVSIVGEGVDPTLGERVSSGFMRGLNSFAQTCEDFLVWFVTNLIGILFFVVIVVVIFLIVRRVRRGVKQPKQPKPPKNEKEQSKYEE